MTVRRFVVLDWNGWGLVDLGDGTGDPRLILSGDEGVLRALAATLNAHPDTYDAHLSTPRNDDAD